MAQNLIIANATYSDVPAIDISKSGGGTARFVDTSDANAIASNIDNGKTAYVNGAKVTGSSTKITPSGTRATITANGTYNDVSPYANVVVAIPYYDGW